MTRALPLLLLLAGCGGAASDAELAERRRALMATADPAITAALADPIMSDADLSVADDSRRLRSVRGPTEASVPPRTKENAALYATIDGLRGGPGCEVGFVVDPVWADRLPAAFRLPAGATLIEASGNDRPGCAARAATFRMAGAPSAIVDRYVAAALGAGYGASSEPRAADRIAGGRRADGATWYMIATPVRSGSEISVIVSEPASPR